MQKIFVMLKYIYVVNLSSIVQKTNAVTALEIHKDKQYSNFNVLKNNKDKTIQNIKKETNKQPNKKQCFCLKSLVQHIWGVSFKKTNIEHITNKLPFFN